MSIFVIESVENPQLREAASVIGKPPKKRTNMLHLNISLKNYWETQEDEFKYVKYENHFSEDEPCNIYLVGIRPRVIIDTNYIKVVENNVELKFKIQNGYEFDDIRALLPLPRKVKGNLVIESNQPYSRFMIRDDDGYFTYVGDDIDTSKISGIEGKAMYTLRDAKFDSRSNFNDLELLYIGKSLRMDKKISAVKRIKNHEKIKRILFNCTQKYFDKEVYIILCSFKEKINLMAPSQHFKDYAGDEKKLLDRLRKNVADLSATRELVTQITEAMLIDYFDTKEFNSDFIGSFGKKNHTYYPFIEKAQLSSVAVEVDLTELCRTYTKTIEPKFYHMVKYFPKDNYSRTTDISTDEFEKY